MDQPGETPDPRRDEAVPGTGDPSQTDLGGRTTCRPHGQSEDVADAPRLINAQIPDAMSQDERGPGGARARRHQRRRAPGGLPQPELRPPPVGQAASPPRHRVSRRDSYESPLRSSTGLTSCYRREESYRKAPHVIGRWLRIGSPVLGRSAIVGSRRVRRPSWRRGRRATSVGPKRDRPRVVPVGEARDRAERAGPPFARARHGHRRVVECRRRRGPTDMLSVQCETTRAPACKK